VVLLLQIGASRESVGQASGDDIGKCVEERLAGSDLGGRRSGWSVDHRQMG
jgi:hypothetical protein